MSRFLIFVKENTKLKTFRIHVAEHRFEPFPVIHARNELDSHIQIQSKGMFVWNEGIENREMEENTGKR